MKKIITFVCYPSSFFSPMVNECVMNIKMFHWFMGDDEDDYFDNLAVFEIKSRKRSWFRLFLDKEQIQIFKQLQP
jgi:hypothetical protein